MLVMGLVSPDMVRVTRCKMSELKQMARKMY